VNSLKRAVCAGRVAGHQAKRADEMQAVADALSLLANIVMAWNTAQMQGVLDRWSQGPRTCPTPELIGHVAPHADRGDQPAKRLPLPDRALRRVVPSLVLVSEKAGVDSVTLGTTNKPRPPAPRAGDALLLGSTASAAS
jgi:hypothetical protein